MLEMHGITKSFDAVKALKGASLSVKPGEIRALLGANGSGKSTMVKVLAGLVKPDGGEITIDAKPVHIHSSRDSAQLGIATAFQDLSLIPTMSVLDNIKLGRETVRRTGTIDAKKDRRDVEDLLARFHLKCDPDAYAQTLMPSTQSMLEVAKAVFARPRLLLLDEVTATLHQDEIEVLFQILQELKAEGVSIIYVTHRMAWRGVTYRNGIATYEITRRMNTFYDSLDYEIRLRAVQCFKECAKWAEEAGVVLALQNHEPVIRSYTDMLDFVRWVDSPNFKCCLDAPNCGLTAHTQSDEYLTRAVQDVGALQMITHANGELREEDGQVVMFPYEAHNPIYPNYRAFIRALKQVGYEGYINYEFCHMPFYDGKVLGYDYVDEQVRLAQRYFRELIAQA